MTRYPAHLARSLMRPVPPRPPVLKGGQGRTISDCLRYWPGIFRIAVCGAVIMAIVMAVSVATHPRVHHSTVTVSP